MMGRRNGQIGMQIVDVEMMIPQNHLFMVVKMWSLTTRRQTMKFFTKEWYMKFYGSSPYALMDNKPL